MTGYVFDFAGQRLEARASGALWWPDRRWLVVADLHLGKSERMARRGGALLPPYEVAATLDRLGAEIAATDPAAVISLGDGFDDDAAGRELPDEVCDRLHRLAEGRDWVWITGNHDAGLVDHCGGEIMVEAEIDDAQNAITATLSGRDYAREPACKARYTQARPAARPELQAQGEQHHRQGRLGQ